MSGCPVHCPKPSSGGVGLVAIVALAAITVKLVMVVVHAVTQAADAVGRILEVVFEVALVTMGVLAAATACAVLGWSGYRIYRRRPRYRVQLGPATIHGEVLRPDLKAIDPPQIRPESSKATPARTTQPSRP